MNNELTFRVILIVVFILMAFIRIYYYRKVRQSGESVSIGKEAREQEGKLSMILRLTLFFSMIPLLTLYVISPHWMTWFMLSFPTWSRWIGVGLGIVSLLLLVWVQQSLGKYWSTDLQLRKQHILVTSGPYRWVRHPMYTAIFTLLIAFSLLSANWLIVLPCIVGIIVVYARIGKEEAMMIEQFGGEYRDYMKRTGRLLPRLTR